MKRKVIKQGIATLTMSLPVSWTKKFGIKSGDELEVDIVDNDLVISTKKIVPEVRKEIDLAGLNDSLIWKSIDVLYTKGVDEIKITIEREKMNLIQRIVDSLIGFAIVEQKNNLCVIKSVSKIEKDQFDNMFKRIFFILQGMADESLEAFKKGDKKKLLAIKESDYSLNKMVFYCLRILSKEGYKEAKKTPALYDLTWLLENMGDRYADLSKELTKLKPTNDIIKIYEKLNENLSKLYFLLFKFNRSGLEDIYEKNIAIRKEIQRLIGLKQKVGLLSLVHMQKISELINFTLESILAISL